MRKSPLRGRTLALLAVIAPLLGLFIFVGLRSGPLAPVAVTLASVETQAITPALFGIGTVEARYTYKIGPTSVGRLKSLVVHVGDPVQAGQVLGDMDPIDLDDRIRSLEALFKRAQASVQEAQARQTYASSQARSYEKLYAARSTSEEVLMTKRQELQIADAALAVANEDIARTSADREALIAQRQNLRLIAPVDGIISARDVDPGSTVVAGQTIVEVIDTQSLWVNVRFDQISAAGLASGQPASIVLRSRGGQALQGSVLRVEPKADAITEEMLAKVVFASIPHPLPPLGELAEVTVDLPPLAATLVIPNASVQREGDKIGVWLSEDGALRFAPITLGVADLDGKVQVLAGLHSGDNIVAYSEKALNARSRIHVLEHMPGVTP